MNLQALADFMHWPHSEYTGMQWSGLHRTCEPSVSCLVLHQDPSYFSGTHKKASHEAKSLKSSNLYLFHVHRLKHCKFQLYYMACRRFQMIITLTVFSLSLGLAEPHKHHKVILQKLQKGLPCPVYCYSSTQHSFLQCFCWMCFHLGVEGNCESFHIRRFF